MICILYPREGYSSPVINLLISALEKERGALWLSCRYLCLILYVAVSIASGVYFHTCFSISFIINYSYMHLHVLSSSVCCSFRFGRNSWLRYENRVTMSNVYWLLETEFKIHYYDLFVAQQSDKHSWNRMTLEGNTFNEINMDPRENIPNFLPASIPSPKTCTLHCSKQGRYPKLSTCVYWGHGMSLLSRCNNTDNLSITCGMRQAHALHVHV